MKSVPWSSTMRGPGLASPWPCPMLRGTHWIASCNNTRSQCSCAATRTRQPCGATMPVPGSAGNAAQAQRRNLMLSPKMAAQAAQAEQRQPRAECTDAPSHLRHRRQARMEDDNLSPFSNRLHRSPSPARVRLAVALNRGRNHVGWHTSVLSVRRARESPLRA